MRAAAFVGRAQAAVAATVDPRWGACIAAESGAASIDSNHISFGVLALYDAALLGRADLVVDELREVVTGSDAPLLVAMRDHASALHAEDPYLLERVAERLASMGARPLAAAAYGHAAASHRPGSATARRSAARSALWAAAGASASSPTVEIEGGVTARELEIAAHAADGLTSRQIGQSLFLSVRTVDNHLRRVYAKLEVADRVELGEVLAPRPEPPRGDEQARRL